MSPLEVSSGGDSKTQPKSCFPKLQCSHQGGTELCVSPCCAQGCSWCLSPLCVWDGYSPPRDLLDLGTGTEGQGRNHSLGLEGPELVPSVAHGQDLWECPTDVALVVHETLPNVVTFPTLVTFSKVPWSLRSILPLTPVKAAFQDQAHPVCHCQGAPSPVLWG